MGSHRRIASLLSSNTAMAVALGLEERLVGISHECDWPPSILNRPRLTSTRIDPTGTGADIHRQVQEDLKTGKALYSIDEEALLELEPDLILTQAQCEVCAVAYDEVAAVVARFPEGRRPEVMSFQPESIGDVLRDIERLGAEAGDPERAAEVVRALRARMERVTEVCASRAEDRPRTLVLEWTEPPMPGGCWTPEFIERAGGTPLLCATGAGVRILQPEAIAGAGIEALIVAPCGFRIEQTLAEVDALLASAPLRDAPAVRAGRVYIGDGNALFNRPGPRLVDTLELMAHMISPERARTGGVPLPEGMGATLAAPPGSGDTLQWIPIGGAL